jgi:hypothetical protein
MLLRALTDAWESSGIATIESGTPNTVQAGFDTIGNDHPNGRPNLSNPSAPVSSMGIDAQWFGGTAGTTYDYAAFNKSGTLTLQPNSTFRFIVPFLAPGNVGRNSLFGPGQIYFDTAVQRDIPVHLWRLENQALSFRLELFNAFNHPNLFTPSYIMNDINYNNTAITINGGRQIKLWLKYSF